MTSFTTVMLSVKSDAAKPLACATENPLESVMARTIGRKFTEVVASSDRS